MGSQIEKVQSIIDRCTMKLFNVCFRFRVEEDYLFKNRDGEGRVFIQLCYKCACNKTGHLQEWRGRKWYISSHMTEDEVIKTAYAAYQSAIIHEIMETFLVDNKILFNPHVSYEALLSISDKEIKRD